MVTAAVSEGKYQPTPCIETILDIDPQCAVARNSGACVSELKAAENCLIKVNPSCKSSSHFDFYHVFDMYSKLGPIVSAQVQHLSLSDKAMIERAITDVYLVAIQHCNGSVMEGLVKAINESAEHNNFNEMVRFVKKTQLKDLSKSIGVNFSNGEATLLLVYVFKKAHPAKSNDEILDMAYAFFPPKRT